MGKITAKEIAAQLGISAAAVSLAINGKRGVSDETRAQVLDACRKAGYIVDPPDSPVVASVSVAPTKTLCFMIFIDELLHIWENSPFYTYNLQGIEAAAASHGYNTLIRYLHTDTILTPSNLQFLQSLDGLILLGTDITTRSEQAVRTMLNSIPNTPKVVLDSMLLAGQVDCLGNDNFGGAYQAVIHLAVRGCRKIAYLCSRPRITIFEEREAGVRAALAHAGLPLFAKIPCGISNDEAYADVTAWLKGGNPLPDGIFAENDVLAAAASRALSTFGLSVPADVSIVGFDNLPITEQTSPPLSTIHSHKNDLGATAVNMLLQRQWLNDYAKGRPVGFVKSQMSTLLVERNSVR